MAKNKDWESESSDVCVVLCTVPDSATGQTLARDLVEARLAACVNILPSIQSIYWWEGAVCQEPEALMVIKTTNHQKQALAERIALLHPYQTPEVISLPVTSGLSAYLTWVREQTNK